MNFAINQSDKHRVYALQGQWCKHVIGPGYVALDIIKQEGDELLYLGVPPDFVEYLIQNGVELRTF